MQKGREDFFVDSKKTCVSIALNGDFDGSTIKTFYMDADWTFQDFLKAASRRLDNLVPIATRCFDVDGLEINDCMMIADNDFLFLSNDGSDFLMPTVSNLSDVVSSDGDVDVTICNGYRVKELLGRGGFGEVRLGEHQMTGEKVALKFLSRSGIQSINAAERTVNEIQCLARLNHKNIIKLLHHMDTPQYLIMIFELMEGGDLLKYLLNRGNTASEMALIEDECKLVFHQILSGISYAHNQHICHRDLKLENILLKGPNLLHVKIADFGLSDFYRPGEMMKSNCGTLSFLSPEVFRGTANHGPPLDVWAMGVILFCMSQGKLPFENVELGSKRRPRDAIIKARILKCEFKFEDNLSSDIKDLIRKLLKLDPDERASIPEVLNHYWMKQSIRYESNSKYLLNPLHSNSSSASNSPMVSPVRISSNSSTDSEVTQPLNDGFFSSPMALSVNNIAKNTTSNYHYASFGIPSPVFMKRNKSQSDISENSECETVNSRSTPRTLAHDSSHLSSDSNRPLDALDIQLDKGNKEMNIISSSITNSMSSHLSGNLLVAGIESLGIPTSKLSNDSGSGNFVDQLSNIQNTTPQRPRNWSTHSSSSIISNSSSNDILDSSIVQEVDDIEGDEFSDLGNSDVTRTAKGSFISLSANSSPVSSLDKTMKRASTSHRWPSSRISSQQLSTVNRLSDPIRNKANLKDDTNNIGGIALNYQRPRTSTTDSYLSTTKKLSSNASNIDNKVDVEDDEDYDINSIHSRIRSVRPPTDSLKKSSSANSKSSKILIPLPRQSLEKTKSLQISSSLPILPKNNIPIVVTSTMNTKSRSSSSLRVKRNV